MKKILLALALFCIPLKAQSAHSASLSWTASTDVGVAYNVYRMTGTCPATPTLSGFTKINSSPVTGGTSFVDSTVTVGTYCYEVTATLNGAESGPSNAVPGVVLPSAPTLLRLTSIT